MEHMYISLIIFGVTYFFIATEKIDKTIAAILGAAAVIMIPGAVTLTHTEAEAAGKAPTAVIEHNISEAAPAESGHKITEEIKEGVEHEKAHAALVYEELMSKIDLNVIFLLCGMMMIVNVLSVTGIFEWIAIMIAQKSKGNGPLIMVLLMVATAVLSAFLDNVTTVILIAPITILLAEILEIPATPILILEALFSNIGGTATLVGDPPNILIGSSTHLTFNDFLVHLGPVVVVIMAVSLFAVFFVFRKRVTVAEGPSQRVMKAKPENAIVEPKVLWRSLPVFALVLLGFFTSRQTGVEPGIVALAGGVLMSLTARQNTHHILEKVEWGTIFFFIGLFMLIGALEVNGVFEFLGQKILGITQGNLLVTAIVILWASAIFSAIVDNIPLVIAMIPLIKSILPTFYGLPEFAGLDAAGRITTIDEPLFWALALGACLGGNGTLIGASANVVISQIAKRNRYKITFGAFTKYGLPIMLLSLVISTGYIYLRYFAMNS